VPGVPVRNGSGSRRPLQALAGDRGAAGSRPEKATGWVRPRWRPSGWWSAWAGAPSRR